MSYVKADCILPRELLEQIQEYAGGLYLYIPKKEKHYKEWGTNTNYKNELRKRDAEIYEKFRKGLSTSELAEEYFLSIKSIQRILLQEKRKHKTI
jgi:Mor family transcriptional regulator